MGDPGPYPSSARELQVSAFAPPLLLGEETLNHLTLLPPEDIRYPFLLPLSPPGGGDPGPYPSSAREIQVSVFAPPLPLGQETLDLTLLLPENFRYPLLLPHLSPQKETLDLILLQENFLREKAETL